MFDNLITSEGLEAQITVTQHAFATMADIEVYPSHAVSLKDTHLFQATLCYAGSCSGHLVLECSQTLAYTFTARLMSLPTPVSFDADVEDALGELVNTIGGNLKGLLAENTELSMPFAIEPDELEKHGKPHPRLSFVAMASEFGLINVHLYANLFLKKQLAS